MNEPARQLPCSSNATCCISAMPTPSASPPCTWPSTIVGLMRTPQSSTATNRRSRSSPVPASTSTTQTYAPHGYVRFGGS